MLDGAFVLRAGERNSTCALIRIPQAKNGLRTSLADKSCCRQFRLHDAPREDLLHGEHRRGTRSDTARRNGNRARLPNAKRPRPNRRSADNAHRGGGASPIETFLLTCETSAEAIVDQQRRTRASTLQLVDTVDAGAHRALRTELPGIRIVQVIHVTGEESVDEALQVAADVDALLLDSGNPRLAVKGSEEPAAGTTGR